MRVEVILLNAELAGDFSAFVHLLCREHDLAVYILNYVARCWVYEVAVDVRSVALLVSVDALGVAGSDNITIRIPIEISKDIVVIECAQSK